MKLKMRGSSHHVLTNQSENVVYNNIKQLRDENQFFDVTLICEDGAILQAHKLVLASHSDRFKSILTQLSSSISLQKSSIFLTDVTGQEMEDVLDFIYVGEARVARDNLSRFLNVAKTLHINSLIEEDDSNVGPAASKPSSSRLSNSPVKRKLPEDTELLIKNEAIADDYEDEGTTEHDNDAGYYYENEIENDAPEDEASVLTDDNETNKQPSTSSSVIISFKNSSDEPPRQSSSSSSSPTKKKKVYKKCKRQEKEELSAEESAKVLLENLKALGMNKLSKQMIKDSKTRKIVKKIMSQPTRKLPCPVEYMNNEQLIKWLNKEILKDIIEQGKKPRTMVRWGDEACHPLCWPDEIWPWHLVTNPAHAQNLKPEHVNTVETWKIAVSNRLRNKGINPEDYVSEDCTEEEVKGKMRARGIPRPK